MDESKAIGHLLEHSMRFRLSRFSAAELLRWVFLNKMKLVQVQG